MPKVLAKTEKPQPQEKETTLDSRSFSGEVKKTKRGPGNLLLRAVTPEMYISPFDFTEEFNSREFCLEKGFRFLLEPLAFKSEEEWLDYSREVWQWGQSQELRRKQALVSEFLQNYQDDDDILQLLQEQLQNITA